MKNSESQIIPIMDIRTKYKTSESNLTEKFNELEIDILIRRPTNVDIYASGSVINPSSNEPRTFNDNYKAHKGTPFNEEHDLYTKLSEHVSFLTISLAEWSEIIDFGEVLVNRFESIYLKSTEVKLTKKTAPQILRNITSPHALFVINSGIFISPRSGQLFAMDTPLSESDIYIKSSDAEKLLNNHSIDNFKRNADSIQKEYWMSDKLADLNMASELFISKIEINTKREEILHTIEEWLKQRWDTQSDRLIEQSALAIIPDELYGSAPKKQGSATNNVYRSSALTIINETAKAAEDRFLNTGAKRDKATTIRDDLIAKHKFTTNLATAAASIISFRKRNKKNPST